jgi:hypothetical protein
MTDQQRPRQPVWEPGQVLDVKRDPNRKHERPIQTVRIIAQTGTVCEVEDVTTGKRYTTFADTLAIRRLT